VALDPPAASERHTAGDERRDGLSLYEKPADVREHERLTKASGSRPNLAHLAQRRLLDWPQRFLGVLQDLARLEQRRIDDLDLG